MVEVIVSNVGACVEKVGIGFLYSPALHDALRNVFQPRREVGLRTIFNLITPLCNPASAKVQVLGVYRADRTETMARVMGNLGCKSGFVVHGQDSYDEISITGVTTISRLLEGRVTTSIIAPEDVGLTRARREDIMGGDALRNSAITKSILKGDHGAPRDMVLVNSAAALVAAGRAETLKEGIGLAAESIDSGRALGKLEQLAVMSLEFSSNEQRPSWNARWA